MFWRDIYQWNAVDVVREGRYVQRGLVVGKQESVLLVSFGIDGKDPEPIPYRSTYLDDFARCKNQFSSVTCVRDLWVLYKLSYDKPWVWYPCKILAGSEFYLLTKICTGDSFVVDVVHPDYVRDYPHTNKQTRVNDFIKEEHLMPQNFVLSPTAVAHWKTRFGMTYPIGIIDGCFQFLHLRSNRMTQDSVKVLSVLRDAPEPHVWRSRKRYSGLPYDLVATVFSYVDVVQQARMRRVCVLWNSAAFSRACTTLALVDLQSYIPERHEYVLALCLKRCAARSTKFLAIVGGPSLESWENSLDISLRKMLEILKKICVFNSWTLPNLIFAKLKPFSGEILSATDLSLSETIRSICRRLIFRDVTIRQLFGFPDWYCRVPNCTNQVEEDECYIDSDLHIASDATCVEKELLEVFDRAAANSKESEHRTAYQRASEWIDLAAGTDEESQSNQRTIIDLLKTWQRGCLPPFGPNIQWRDVETASTGALLKAIRTSTVRALMVCHSSMLSNSYYCSFRCMLIDDGYDDDYWARRFYNFENVSYETDEEEDTHDAYEDWLRYKSLRPHNYRY